MEKLRQRLGKPIIINCGYRCPEHNFEVSSGIKISEIPRAPRNSFEFTGAGYYEGQGFCHVDVGDIKPRPNTWGRNDKN